MKIRIDGTNTLNKGAELMLYAILEEIQKKCPKASVDFNSLRGNPELINTQLDFKKPLYLKFARVFKGILRRVSSNLLHFPEFHFSGNVDLLLDASGFRHSDHWMHSDAYLNSLESYYSLLKKRGAKIILLPQAFGPFNTTNGKRSVDILNKYCDYIFAREDMSYQYLVDSGFDVDKVSVYSDFSITVKGVIPSKFINLKGYICVIPNERMVSHTSMTRDQYIEKTCSLINGLREINSKVFLLNHEGEQDLKLCNDINSYLEDKVSVVSGLNAKEIKGVIGNSSLVVSSRFHGVASALNQGVPCFATSWSHKYELLFKDFGLEDHLIDLNDSPKVYISKIKNYIDDKDSILLQVEKKGVIQAEIDNLWAKVWSIAKI